MNSILDFLRDVVGRHEPEAEHDDGRSIARAAAVLLIELALTDAGTDEVEREMIERAMRESFGLDEGEMRELLDQAGAHQRESHSLHDYTHALRTGLEPDARADLVEWLWRVAYADGRLDRHEELLVRRLADLLGVPHREFIRRKHRAGEACDSSAG